MPRPRLFRCLVLAFAATLCAPAIAAPQSHRAPPPASSARLDAEAFTADIGTPLLREGSRGAAVARVQILLDRAWFSTGEIDGRFAGNMRRMVEAYQRAAGLKPTGTVTPDTWRALRRDASPLLTRHTISQQEASGPFEKIPADMMDRAAMNAQPYASLEEALAERFHASPALLRALNRGVRFEPGEEIVVPNVGGPGAPRGAASIEIDKGRRVLYVLDARRQPLAAFPISIGNERNDPLPLGVMTIRNEVRMPSFTYDPQLLKNAPADAQKVEVPPGPNNPVGTVWLGLSKPHWGIHGTPEPSNVGHSETNGCIHLTNWDAERVASLVKAGFKVDVRR